MNQDELARQIILEHYKRPQNKVKSQPPGYDSLRGINPSCGDELELFLKVEDGEVKEVKWNGEGCSICCAATSVMTQEVNGLNVEQMKDKAEQYRQMLTGHEFNESEFEDALAFEGLSKFPARFKCANLGWHTLLEYFKQNNL